MNITYKTDLLNVDWEAAKAQVAADHFDNGRTAAQLRTSFKNSFATCLAYAEGLIVGKARALSDGVCNAYIVDVWTYTPYRRQGIASEMMKRLMEKLEGQHLYLFTDDIPDLYTKLGFEAQGTGLGRVVGQWRQTPSQDSE